jgi:acetoin utilization deacetylase AcuC-like enzyme
LLALGVDPGEPLAVTAPYLHVVTDERCLGYAVADHPEKPCRISDTVAALRQQRALTVAWQAPLPVREETLIRAHTSGHLHHILSTTDDFDPDTPWFPDLGGHAWRSAGGALTAMEAALRGQMAFSLMRPPGHHASRARAMGFCYLNNVAIAMLEGLTRGVNRVAVFDFDVHHGNGTEAILLNNPRAATFSVHQFPCYPDTGWENVGINGFNYPVAPLTPRLDYRKVLDTAIDNLAAFNPGLVGVSAGFDAYANDPLAQETLELEDYHWLGQRLRGLGVPLFSVLEGGYSQELPQLILAYLRGLCGK